MSFSSHQAFGISEEDVATALKALSMPHDDATAEAWLARLDQPAIAQAACEGGDDLDEQTEAAQQAIQAQLLDLTAHQRLAGERHEQLTEQPSPVRHRPRVRA